MTETVHEQADLLRQYATHFAQRDWNYTRHHKIRGLYTDTLSERLRDVAGYARRDFLKRVRRERSNLDEVFGRTPWWRMVRAHWRYHNHLPDGVLDNGAVITHWEETGEYLQYVQPSVGALVADLMDAHPHLPEVRAVAAEMKRISDGYSDRIAAGQVD